MHKSEARKIPGLAFTYFALHLQNDFLYLLGVFNNVQTSSREEYFDVYFGRNTLIHDNSARRIDCNKRTRHSILRYHRYGHRCISYSFPTLEHPMLSRNNATGRQICSIGRNRGNDSRTVGYCLNNSRTISVRTYPSYFFITRFPFNLFIACIYWRNHTRKNL